MTVLHFTGCLKSSIKSVIFVRYCDFTDFGDCKISIDVGSSLSTSYLKWGNNSREITIFCCGFFRATFCCKVTLNRVILWIFMNVRSFASRTSFSSWEVVVSFAYFSLVYTNWCPEYMCVILAWHARRLSVNESTFSTAHKLTSHQWLTELAECIPYSVIHIH